MKNPSSIYIESEYYVNQLAKFHVTTLYSDKSQRDDSSLDFSSVELGVFESD